MVTGLTFTAVCTLLFTCEAIELGLLVIGGRNLMTCELLFNRAAAAGATDVDATDSAVVAGGRVFSSHDAVFAVNKNVSIS